MSNMTIEEALAYAVRIEQDDLISMTALVIRTLANEVIWLRQRNSDLSWSLEYDR